MKYQEEQKINSAVIALFIIFIIAIPFVFYYVQLSTKPSSWVPPFLAILEMFLVFILLNFYKLKIGITNECLEFGFGLFKKRFKLEDVVSCEPTNIRFGQYLGMGIRLGFDGTIAYNTRFGKAVKIKIGNKKRPYVLTSDNPQRLCKALKE